MSVSIKLPDFDAMTKEVVAEVKRRIEDRTPVRTGLARASWEIEEADGGARIVNRVPYVGYLEYGTSKMEPFHMVRTTLEEVPDILAAAFDKAKREAK